MDGDSHSKEELIATINEMNQRIADLESRNGEEKWLEHSLRRRTIDLSERMKELECIHELLHLSLKQTDPLGQNAEKIMAVIKDGWQYPDAACVRIKWDGCEIKSFDFKEARNKQIEPIVVGGKRRGEVEVGYTTDKPAAWQGPFLREEAKLLRSISLWLSLVIERLDRQSREAASNGGES
jgi:hypothetical protein